MGWIAVFGLGLLIGGAASRPPSDAERWLRDVSYIISEDEREGFAALHDDSDRARFIEGFWRRRDPDPSTEFNPVREEYYRRLEYAERHFGPKSERAHVWVNYGKPQQRLVFPVMEFEITLYPQKPSQTVLSSYPAVPVENPEAEIWSYWSLPGGGELAAPLELLFMRVPVGQAGLLSFLPHFRGNDIEQKSVHAKLLLNTPLFRGSRTASEDFHLVYAGEPRFAGIREFYRQVLNTPDSLDSFAVGRNLVRLRRPSGDWLEDAEALDRRLREQVESSLYFDTLEADVEHWFLKSADGFVCVALSLHLDVEGFQRGDEVTVLAEMRREGSGVARWDDSLRIEAKAEERDEITYPMRMVVRPGRYTLDIHVMDRTHRRHRLLSETLEVPDFGSGFALSDIVLCREVMKGRFSELPFANLRRDWTLGDWNPLQADDLLLLPARGARFRRGDVLTVFFEVYEPGVGDDGPDVQVEFVLESGPMRLPTPPARVRELTEGGTSKISVARSLSLSRLPPGPYRLGVRASDRALGAAVSRVVSFEVY